MIDGDSSRTRRETTTLVTAELGAAGFEDAVEIGHGGFGVVYRCWQVALNRTVAVKVLTAALDEDNRARFVREQQAMGQLTGHPNIVTVLTAGSTASGQPYLVMPYHPLDSLDAWIRNHGPLPLDKVLSIGVKIAGALESAHRLQILHRDVKPGNILLTDYGEPALTDFGIAHIAGGFRTGSGLITGSPAFTAPEVLAGGDPSPAADVYGLGATMFCALTGHAAFERRTGERLVTQFVRITTDPIPDLRETGVPRQVSDLVETAMSRDAHNRPSAAALGEAIRQVQRRLGFAVGEMALRVEPGHEARDELVRAQDRVHPAMAARDDGNLPLELTSFINRRNELSELKNLLSTARQVTLTGTGGVGKTRLALRAASQSRHDFADGVWLVELAEVSDDVLLVDVVAAAVGVRDDSAKPLLEVLTQFLSSRTALLILDNCEQIVDAIAKLTVRLLRTCPELCVLATSREPLNLDGEAVLRLLPLTIPDPERRPTLAGMPRFHAVALFVDRAAAAVPGFELSEDNKDAVTGICARLDGLPLAIELAAARMRSMSPEQILQRLDDRYNLLTHGKRSAPLRQQTLRWCIDWTYHLCDPAEQRLWAQLSVFAGSFDLDAVEQICGADTARWSTLDALSSLVDKSVLIRQESDSVVRYRIFETLREYGRQRLRESGEYDDLRRRHRNWYQKLALDAEAGWISHRQPDWITRLEREQSNLREALENCLDEDTEEAAVTGLRTAAALYEFWTFRGLYGEGRSWLDRVLAHRGATSIPDRVKALQVRSQLASWHGDFRAAVAPLEEARALAEQDPTPTIKARIAHAEGILELIRGAPARGCSSLERAVELLGSNRTDSLYVDVLASRSWAYEVCGDTERSSESFEELLTITEPCGELFYRCAALRGMGVAAWQRGDRHRAEQLLQKSVRVNQRLRSPIVAAFNFHAMAWVAVSSGNAERAAILMGAGQSLWPTENSVTTVFPTASPFHRECERETLRALGSRRFEEAFRRGRKMSMDAAVVYALGQRREDGISRPSVSLTPRERQVAELVSQGLSNKQIAAKLVISQRTAQGHVENILTKLGFTSRAQIAAWVIEDAQQQSR
ncbi:protein kinase [Nocardia gamkensis]|uniref:protein kinase domain-containing protein n=1 Tax=Nocardia gamkensis TaxID=352869 RepID=UPI0033F263E8